jgi:FkbH-like protein
MHRDAMPLMLDWLPAAADFRQRLRAALEVQDPAGRLEQLAALAQHRLGLVETLQLDKQLGELPSDTPAGFATIRLAILASSTVDHLLPAIRVAGLRRRLLIDIYAAPFGQHRQEVLDSASSLYRFKPQFVLLSLTAQEALAGVPLSATAAEADDNTRSLVEGVRDLWRRVREGAGATVIQQTMLDVSDPLFGSYDRLVPGSPSSIIARANDRLSEAAAADGVLLHDVARRAAREGVEQWFDRGRWLQGKLEIAPQAAGMYGELVVRLIAAQRGLSKKCLVLDLDNTLWGGVIGDDGIEGIVLGEGSAAGEAHLALQRYAKRMSERGIILAVCSKNDPAIAEAAFRDHPEMLLERSDFAAFVANWQDKAKNLEVIAQRLNIGLDSLVFVDDNPVERARIRESLPMVAVPELPDDIAFYVPCLADAGYFEAVAFTSDDRKRAGQYAANAERDALMGSSQSMEDFLRGLNMGVSYGPFAPVNLARVTQLINKTNQFNTTTRRYLAEEVTRLSGADDAITLQFRLLDRFGDNGIVSAMILSPNGEEGVLKIDNWVMSCRVFGRELEYEAMNIAVEAARQRGARALCADYVPTKKNTVIRELFASLGFDRIAEAAPGNGSSQWHLSLEKYAARETSISRLKEQDERPGNP